MQYLCIGVLLALPLAWVVGLFNPIGYLGVPPWRVPKEAKIMCPEHGYRNCFCQRHRKEQ